MNEKTKKRIQECREKRLKKLDLTNCDLTEIPEAVEEMGWLEILDLSINQRLVDLRPLKKMQNLWALAIYSTQISDLRPLEKLFNLRTLYISNTLVTDLRPLKRLSNLQKLYAPNTPITDLRPLENLPNLQILDVSNTQITDLLPILSLIQKGIPVKWDYGYLDNEYILVGGENSSFTNPPREIIEQGNEVILRYFEEKKRSHTIKVREAKLFIVGQGGAGKTTLLHKLLNDQAELPSPYDTTRGIEIRYLNGTMPGSTEPFRLNIWDFGGQNIQHYAHQFFLTGSALYVLVTNERVQNPNFQYWLNTIEMLGGASPVVIVQNKIAGHFEEIRNAAAIRERFGNVLNRFFAVDLKDAPKAPEFRDLRREILFLASQLPHVEREYPASFAAVREKVEAAAVKGRHSLKWDEYLEVGAEIGIESEDLMKDYANAFTFLGVCQYFPDDVQLRNFVFLNPKWIIDALFQLLTHPKVQAQYGVFEERDIFDIWHDREYHGMEGHLVRMMENFELCYRIGDSHRYIVPQCLPSEQDSYNWDEPAATPLLYEYKFMPKGIVTRLICRLHTRIEGDHVWNDAVIFAQPDGKARVFVREVYGENKIEVYAAGEGRGRLFNEVIRQIDDIHATSKLANLQVDKKMPCPCKECSANPARRYFFKYDYLENAIDKGRETVPCGETTDDVSIAEIFRKSEVWWPDTRHSKLWYDEPVIGKNTTPVVEISVPDFVPASLEKEPLRTFISYSHRDFNQRKRLEVHLKPLIWAKRITIWTDAQISPGDQWDDVIQRNLQNSDFILLLFSPDFIASDYIWKKEVEIAFRLQEEEGKIVVLVFLKNCLLSALHEVKEKQFIPHRKGELTAVVDWPKEDGYVEVAKQILALVDGK